MVEKIWAQDVSKRKDLFLYTLKNGAFTERQAKDEIRTMLIAGHETAATTLTFTLFLLATNPEKETRLRSELGDVLGDVPPGPAPIGQLTYTRQVLQESMRLFPPAWGTSRTPLEDEEVDGHYIPENSIVNVCPYAMHRHTDFWPAAGEFQPERFDVPPPSYTYFPFGGGPRKCIGEHFAMTEMIIVLARFCQRLRFELVSAPNLEVVSKITLRPKDPVLLRVRRLR